VRNDSEIMRREAHPWDGGRAMVWVGGLKFSVERLAFMANKW
jgi:hypothetical protein